MNLLRLPETFNMNRFSFFYIFILFAFLTSAVPILNSILKRINKQAVTKKDP